MPRAVKFRHNSDGRKFKNQGAAKKAQIFDFVEYRRLSKVGPVDTHIRLKS